ncbi:MAG TPA: prolipoprotein diacylglyceryl transferase [Lentisphaeria bacterium]|nr:MAG: prolipoprotein diacylglyceryl transferase [Lentisphaerae bacterium GWF2_50_93]HCE46421.1 prolipoprotein diacylglyceryl transferase [Lentisphaeria bacterium]
MHSVALHIGSLTIYWYGIMAALGFLSAVYLLMLNRKTAGMDAEQITDVAMISMIAGIVGARIFYVVQFWKLYRDNPLSIIRIDQGGLVFFGGFLCAISVLIYYCLRKKLNILKVLDLFGPSLAIGHFFGRIGCFLNGCCYGKPSDQPWSVQFPAGSSPATAFPSDPLHPEACISQHLHPVQIYESIFNLALAFALCYLVRKLKPGQTAAAYLICYGLGRFTIESMRGDHRQFILDKFTVSQSIGLMVAAAGILLLTYTLKNNLGRKQKNA